MVMFKRRLAKNRRNGLLPPPSPSNAATSRCQNDASSDSSTSNVGSCSGTFSSLNKPAIKSSSLPSTKPQHYYNNYSTDADVVVPTKQQQNSTKTGESTAELTTSNNSSYNEDTVVVQQQQQQPQPQQKKKSVRFLNVNIREFERILGDNPSCSSGAPISIGWGYGNQRTVPVDNFEASKQHFPRRAQLELALSRQAREECLLEWGVPFHDIIDAIRTNVRVKHQRRRTVNAIGTYDRWEEVMENASRKIKRTLLLKKNKKDSQPTHPKKFTKKDPFDEGLRVPCRRLSDTVDNSALAMESMHNNVGNYDGLAAMAYSLTLPSRIETEDNCVADQETTKVPVPEVYVSPKKNLLYVHASLAKLANEVPTLDGRAGDRNMMYDDVSGNDDNQRLDSPNFVVLTEKQNRNEFNPRFDLFDSQYVESIDDPGAYYCEAKSVNTMISDFTQAEPSDYTNYEDDDDDDELDELEDLDRDVSHWEVRSSSEQGCPAIRRIETPVVISEDCTYDFWDF